MGQKLSDQSFLIALGGNMDSIMGCPAQTLQAALAQLQEAGAVVEAVSRFYQTPCFPAGAGPDYVNAAACLGFDGDAPALLALLHEIEAHFGRERVQRWGQRTLDLDLIAAGVQILPDRAGFDHWRNLAPEDQIGVAPETLILPHPRLQDRAFVLVPLADVAPGWVHPVLGQSVTQMLDALPPEDVAQVRPC